MRRLAHTATVLGILLASAMPAARADFLWGEDGEQQQQQKPDSLYGDPAKKGFAVHDLITIVVDDKTFSSVAGQVNTDRRTRWEDIIKNFIRVDTKDGFKLKDGLKQIADPEINLDSRFRNENRGSTQRTTRLTYTITAEVKEVLPNGTMVLEARTTKQVGEEHEKVTLTGVVRVEDITRENTVKAERLANLGLKVEGEGPVGDTQKRGWLTRILEAIWPF